VGRAGASGRGGIRSTAGNSGRLIQSGKVFKGSMYCLKYSTPDSKYMLECSIGRRNWDTKLTLVCG